MSARRVLVAAALLLAAPSGAWSQEGGESRALLADWQRRMLGVQDLLVAGRWQEAHGRVRGLVSEMVQRLKSGEASAALLAIAVTQQALAEAGLGREEEAVWHFHAAQNLNAAFRTAPLTDYGEAGELLSRHPLRRWGEAPRGWAVFRLDDPNRSVRPPRILEGPTMVFRASAEVLRSFPRDLRVEFVIDAQGRPRQPVVSGSLVNPAPVLVSLQVLRSWRFEAAEVAGEAVAVFYELGLPLTEGAARRARQDLTSRALALAGAEPPP